MPTDAERRKIGLPRPMFLYTLEQVERLLALDKGALSGRGKEKYVYFRGRTPGVKNKDLIEAINIALPADAPEWRVDENEFIRWAKRRGFRRYDY